MERYLHYFDRNGGLIYQKDRKTGEFFDYSGKLIAEPEADILSRWENEGGKILECCMMNGRAEKRKCDDDDTPPPWLDEFEYIDWCMTH